MKRKWVILSGVHVDKAANLITPADPESLTGVIRKPGDGTFYPGDVIETEADLSKFNASGSIKFQRMDDSGPGDDLENETAENLYAIAKAEGLNLPPAMGQTDLVIAVRAGLAFKQATSQDIAFTPEGDDGLEKMTVKQLREHARNEEVDLDDTMNKTEIINAIREAGALA